MGRGPLGEFGGGPGNGGRQMIRHGMAWTSGNRQRRTMEGGERRDGKGWDEMGRGHFNRSRRSKGKGFNFFSKVKKEREQVKLWMAVVIVMVMVVVWYGMYYAVYTRPCTIYTVAVYSSNSSIVPCLS